jgi:hypothetical protein
MIAGERAGLRFLDGKTLKGHLVDFSETAGEVTLKDYGTEGVHAVPVAGLKAIFFVKSFEGGREYGIRKTKGSRIFVKFTDGEDMVGFLEGDVPWGKRLLPFRAEDGQVHGILAHAC